MIARDDFLLVGRIVRLVDDQQPHAGQRSKDGAARTHDDVDLAARAALPRIEALSLGERGVQNGNAVAECRLETLRRLRRQRDLRHEHDRATAFPHDAFDRLDVHVRLAARGDAIEKCGLEALRIERGVDPLQRTRLLGRRRRRWCVRLPRRARVAAGRTYRSCSAPARTARAITALLNPASIASARGTPGCSRTNCASACAFLPRVTASPGSRTRTRYSLVRGSTKCRSRRNAPDRTSARTCASSAPRSPIRRASGWRSSCSSAKPSGELVPNQADQAGGHRRIALRVRPARRARTNRACAEAHPQARPRSSASPSVQR